MFNCTYIPPIETGLGYIHIYADEQGITEISFADHAHEPQHPNATVEQCRQELSEYFTKKRTEFTVALHLIGTPFQLKSWQALMAIPYGQTRSYKEQALELGSSNYARAVGHANARNPISIIVPCHRVIGSNQTLTGYAGGLNRKQALLTLENS